MHFTHSATVTDSGILEKCEPTPTTLNMTRLEGGHSRSYLKSVAAV